MPDSAHTSSEQASRLMETLGLTEDELCRILDVDPLTLISGQLDHAHQLPILLDLLSEPKDQVGASALRRWVRTEGPAGTPALRRWVRTEGPAGTPIDALLKRDFAAFENALGELERRGFVIKGGERS